MPIGSLFASAIPLPNCIPISDGSGKLDAWITDGSGGGGIPGGNDTELQYNDAGVFGGISGATSDGSSVIFAADRMRATSPRFITGLSDSNGNELFLFAATASAVNELTYANAATGFAPRFTASGSDTNIGIDMATKGTGDFTVFCSPGSTSPHGFTLENSNGAPLFRFNRSTVQKAAIGVASGSNSLIAGDAVDEFDFLSINSKALNFSANGGSFINFRINPSGQIDIKQGANDFQGGLRTYRSDTSAYISFYMGGDNNSYFDLRVNGTHEFYVNSGTFAGRLGAAGVTTQAPAGATALPWKLGSIVAGGVTPDATQSVFVDINGTVVKLIMAA